MRTRVVTVPKLADMREIMCLEPKALRAAVEQMMKLGDYDINTRLQKFLAETNEISGIRSPQSRRRPRG